MVIVLAIVVVGFIAIVVLNNQSNGSNANGGSGMYTGQGDPEAFAELYSEQPVLGDENAPVQIVQFGDYKCPACKNFEEQLVPIIKQEYVDTGKAQFYFMNYPFLGDDAAILASYAEAVYATLGNDAFWTYNSAVYERQGDERLAWGNDEFNQTLIQELFSEEEATQVLEAYESGDFADIVADEKAFAESQGVTGTPSLFINGKKVEMDNLEQVADLNKLVEEAATNG